MTLSKAIFVLFLITAGLFETASAQSLSVVKGRVTDERGKALPYASVVLKQRQDSVRYKAVASNEQGAFTFSAVRLGDYIIEVGMLGYQTATKIIAVTTSQIDAGSIGLMPATKALNMVTVTAQKPVIEVRPDKIVVNLNDGLTAGASALEIMDRLPGVQVSPDEQLSLNGRGVRIYLDGKPTPLSAEALAGLLKGMPAGAIQKIELLAHPSAKFDAAGTGGIINIVRKRNGKAGLSGNAYGGLGQGRYGKHNGGLNMNYKGAGYNLLINNDYLFNKYYIDNELLNRLANGSSLTLINSKRQNRAYTPTAGLDLYLSRKTTLSFSGMAALQWFNKDAQSITHNPDQILNIFNQALHTDGRNYSGNLHLQHDLDTAGQTLTADADYYRYHNATGQANLESIYSATGLLNSNPQRLEQDRRFDVYSFKTDYTLPLKNKAQLEMGVKSSYVLSDNSNLGLDNSRFIYRENVNALYGTYSGTKQSLSYQWGMRAEHTWSRSEQLFSRRYLQLFPSAYLTYQIKPGKTLMLNVDRRVNRPTYEDLNPLIRLINSTNYLQGNPGLLPATSLNFSGTYGYRSALFITFEFSLTQNDFTYLPQPFNATGIITTRPENNLDSRYYNVVVAFNKQLRPWWYTSTNLTVNRQSFAARNDAALSNPGLTAFNFDSYDSFSLSKTFSFLVLLKYRGKSQLRNITNDAYFTFTTGIKQTLWSNKAAVSLNVSDVFHTYKSAYRQQSPSIEQYWRNQYETTVLRLNVSYNFGGKIKKTKAGNGVAEEKRRTDAKEN